MIPGLMAVLSLVPARAWVAVDEIWLPESAQYPAQKAQPESFVASAQLGWADKFGDPDGLGADLDLAGRWSQNPSRRQFLPQIARGTWNSGEFRADAGILPHAWSWADAQGPFDFLDPLDLGSDLLPRRRIGTPGITLGWHWLALDWEACLAWPWTGSSLPEPQERPSAPLPIRQENRWFPQTSTSLRPDLVLRGTLAGPELGFVIGQALDRTPDLQVHLESPQGPYLTPVYSRLNLGGLQARGSWRRLVLRGEVLWRHPDSSGAQWYHQAVLAAELDGSGWMGGTTPSLLVEYHRTDLAETVLRPLHDQILTTLRANFNDARNTELSATAFTSVGRGDLEAVQADASTLLIDHLRVGVGLRWIGQVDPASGLASLSRDSQLLASLRWTL